MTNGTQPFPSDLHKMPFDYAWKWFAFHAEQRTKMFNFMLIVLGIFATAIAGTLDKQLPSSVRGHSLCPGWPFSVGIHAT
jgi:ABC-type uncharacterized transport system permease subunit